MAKKVIGFLVCFLTICMVMGVQDRLNYDGFNTAVGFMSASIDDVVVDFYGFQALSNMLENFEPHREQWLTTEYVSPPQQGVSPADTTVYSRVVLHTKYEEPYPQWLIDAYGVPSAGYFLNAVNIVDVPYAENMQSDAELFGYDMSEIYKLMSNLEHDKPSGILDSLDWLSNIMKVVPVVISWVVMFVVDIVEVLLSVFHAAFYLMGLA